MRSSAASISATGLARLGRQGQVALALDDHRVALAALVVELHVAHLAVLDERVGLVLEPVGLARERRRARRSSSSYWAFRNLTSKSFV